MEKLEVRTIEGIDKLGKLTEAELLILKMLLAFKVRSGVEYRLKSLAMGAFV